MIFKLIQTLILAGMLAVMFAGYKELKLVDNMLSLVNTNTKRQDKLETRVDTWGMIVQNTLDNIDAYKGKRHGRR